MIQGYYSLHKSMFDGSTIKLLISGFSRPSENSKTGPMLQAYVLQHPKSILQAINDKTDSAICGNCKLRHNIDGGCYVMERSLYGLQCGMDNGSYCQIPYWYWPKLLQGKPLRITAYGDPAAIGCDVWVSILRVCKMWTGYSHFPTMIPLMRGNMMASCESLDAARRYWDFGWYTYRIIQDAKDKMPHERWCINHLSKQIQCIDCGICNGKRGNVVNLVHGILANRVFKGKTENE